MTDILSKIPDDLLFLIITYLSWKQEIYYLFIVSKKLKNRIDTEFLWKHLLSQNYTIAPSYNIYWKKVMKQIYKNRIFADTIIIEKDKLGLCQNHFRMAWPPEKNGHPKYWSLKHTGKYSIIEQTDNYLFYFSMDGYLKNIEKGQYKLYWKMLIKDYFNGIQDLECTVRLEGNLSYYRFLKKDQKILAKKSEHMDKDPDWITIIIDNICVKNNNANLHISIDNIYNTLVKYGYSFGKLQLVPHFLTEKGLTLTHIMGP